MKNTLQAIYVISTGEILYSRAMHDYRESSDGKASIDGGRDYTSISGDMKNIIHIQIDRDCLLDFILYMDWNIGNKNAKQYPNGFHGRFEINNKSNEFFYKKLIVNYKDIEEYVNERFKQ